MKYSTRKFLVNCFVNVAVITLIMLCTFISINTFTNFKEPTALVFSIFISLFVAFLKEISDLKKHGESYKEKAFEDVLIRIITILIIALILSIAGVTVETSIL